MTSHLLKRMMDRRFNEVDLRTMLLRVESLKPDNLEGRWVAQARHQGERWDVILEPDFDLEILVIVTAYPN